MLRNSLLLLAFLTTYSLYSQTFFDAVVLDSILKSEADSFLFDLSQPDNVSKVALHLQPYLKLPPQMRVNADNPNFVIDQFKDSAAPNFNPILAEFFSESQGVASATTLETRGKGFMAATSGGLGGLPVTNIVDGVAQFLVQRTKQEVNLAFFRHFYNALEDPRFLELRTLYPQTYQIFHTIDQDIYRYAYFTESMQEAFRKDLKTIPLSMNRLLQCEKYDTLFEKSYHQSLASLALTTSQELVNGSDPKEMIHNLAYSEAWTVDTSIYNLRSSFQLLDLLAGSMQDGERWLKKENLNRLLASKNGKALTIFLGLLYTQAEGIDFRRRDGSFQSLRKLLIQINNRADDMQSFHSYVRNFGGFAVNIQDQLDNIDYSREAEIPQQDGYYRYAASFIGALQEGVAFKHSMGLIGRYDSTFLGVLGHVNNMSLDLQMKNYSSAVVNLVQTIQTSLVDVEFGYKTDLLRYSSFIAAVAQATTAEEISYAIEAVALPVGSSSIKKYSQWNLSVNAYVGGFYGVEYLEGITSDDNRVYGISAPIGIGISRGIDPRRDRGSITFFASLIDIGAVTAFRFQDPLSPQLPEITLQNIFAPGGYMIYGFPKWPLSLGVGYQKGPQLRMVEIDQNTTIEADGFRASAFLAVDIPIFNLYTSSR